MSSGLPALAPVTRLGPHVVRILGCNPGQYTLQGTNTYLIGSSSASLCLFDVGQGVPKYIEHLEKALGDQGPSPQVKDVVLSHWHKDHVNGIGDVLQLLQKLGSSKPRVWKWPCPDHDQDVHDFLARCEDMFVRPDVGGLLHELTEGTTLESLPSARFLHVPGHTTDSIALHLKDEKLLLTADTVLGHGTAVFEDLKDYMSSLDRMDRASQQCDSILPGHGDVASPGIIRMYINHRMQREQQVVEQLSAAPDGLTAEEVMLAIYDGQIADGLKPAATHSVMHHLEKLRKDGRAIPRAGHDDVDRWTVVKNESAPTTNM